jgi:hypothetical protein
MGVMGKSWVAIGTLALTFGAWYLGHQSSPKAGALEGAVSRSELDELRAQLRRQQGELRGTQLQVTRLRDVGADAKASGPAPSENPGREAAQAVPAEAPPLTREQHDRFFDTYFGELAAALDAQGASASRTSDIRSAAETVVAENKLGRLEEVTCSAKLCRVVVESAGSEAGEHFAELFSSRMARHFGGATVHAPGGGERVIGYFSRVDESLQPPHESPEQQDQHL